jgi:hypothetical protein
LVRLNVDRDDDGNVGDTAWFVLVLGRMERKIKRANMIYFFLLWLGRYLESRFLDR